MAMLCYDGKVKFFSPGSNGLEASKSKKPEYRGIVDEERHKHNMRLEEF
jgi:hypothetical protein